MTSPPTSIVKVALRIDVTEAVPLLHRGGGRQWVGGQLVAPEGLDTTGPVSVVVCVHGGSYDKRYFDMQIAGREGYSMAEHFARKGLVVVAIDYLGISDSSRIAHPDQAPIPVIADAQHAATRAIHAQLADGTLAKALPPIPQIRRFGLAHSMGVMLMLKEQAQHKTHSALVLLSYSVKGQRAEPPPPWSPPPPSADPDEDMRRIRREVLRSQFYLDDVPMDVILADEALAVAPTPLFGGQGRAAGIAMADAAQIRVPVLYGAGDKGVFANPHDELNAFESCDDLTFVRFRGSAHSLNLANGRLEGWDRIIRWIGGV